MYLSALLSQALVAFAIEFDNEFEHRMPHRTTKYGATAIKGPWLVSMVMYINCMQYVDDAGISVRDLTRLARTKTNLNGMQRWGYVTVEDSIIRATSKGRLARALWGPLFGTIEQRWQDRLGSSVLQQIREALWTVIATFDFELPDCLPILGHGWFSRVDLQPGTETRSDLPLPALLAKVLLAFAVAYERGSKFSLAMGANPNVKKKGGDPAKEYAQRIAILEERWEKRYGNGLRNLLEGLDVYQGLRPYPDGWRAKVRKPLTLPHYPLVTHRGGFPDGS